MSVVWPDGVYAREDQAGVVGFAAPAGADPAEVRDGIERMRRMRNEAEVQWARQRRADLQRQKYHLLFGTRPELARHWTPEDLDQFDSWLAVGEEDGQDLHRLDWPEPVQILVARRRWGREIVAAFALLGAFLVDVFRTIGAGIKNLNEVTDSLLAAALLMLFVVGGLLSLFVAGFELFEATHR